MPLPLPPLRHVRLFTRALQPVAERIERRFRALLRARRYDSLHRRALLAITPVAAARSRSFAGFLEEVEYHGRRLAKLNMAVGDVTELLQDVDSIVSEILDGRHAPAREQLQLITAHILQQAYYQVREAEAQAFYGLYHAEAEAEGLDDLLARIVRVLTRAFPARAGRLLLDTATARELYMEKPPAGWDGFASYWSFPVGSMGTLQLAFDKPYPWLPREQELMRAIAGRCAGAIERARLEAQARSAEEQERRRIGRELHDDTAQSLLLLRLQLEMMEHAAPPDLRPRLEQSRLITERAIDDLRRTIAALSPAVLDRLGLDRALRQLAARFGKQYRAEVDVRISPRCGDLPPQAQEVIYRVAQESLQNAGKHSRASRVNLSLRSADKRFRLSVCDNGAGFDQESAPAKPLSFGLAGMRERAALLGGTLAVRSVPGKGATVTLDLPRQGRTDV